MVTQAMVEQLSNTATMIANLWYGMDLQEVDVTVESFQGRYRVTFSSGDLSGNVVVSDVYDLLGPSNELWDGLLQGMFLQPV